MASAFDTMEASLHVTNFNQAEFEDGAVGTKFGRDIQEAKVELLNSDIAGWSGVFGISIVDNELQTSGTEAFLPTSEHEEFSVHIVQSLEIGEWSTEIGVRYDKVDLDNNSVSRSFDVGNASIGLGYRLNEHSYLGSSISMSERAPSISELYSNGYHAAASRHERGNAMMSSEEAIASEIYYRYEKGSQAFQFAAFNNDFDDFIYLKGAGIQIENNDVYDYLQADAEIYGFEASFVQTGTWRSADWSTELSYSNITGELDSGEDLRSIPPEKIGIFGQLNFEDVSVGLDVIVADDQTDVPTDQHQTDGFTEVNASVSWMPAFSNGTVIKFGIDNLLNEEIRHHASELKDKVPEAGRNFKILATKTF